MTVNPNCPPWEEDIPAGLESDFLDTVATVVSNELTSFPRSVPEVGRILRIHRDLFKDFVPLDCYAGGIRDPNGTGDRQCLNKNVAVGPAPGFPCQLVRREMNRLCRETLDNVSRLRRDWPQLSAEKRAEEVSVVLAYFIGHFIQIHPFLNGNGRTSRVIWQLSLDVFDLPRHVPIHPRPNAPEYGASMALAMQGNYGLLAHWILDWLTRHAQTEPQKPA